MLKKELGHPARLVIPIYRVQPLDRLSSHRILFIILFPRRSIHFHYLDTSATPLQKLFDKKQRIRLSFYIDIALSTRTVSRPAYFLPHIDTI